MKRFALTLMLLLLPLTFTACSCQRKVQENESRQEDTQKESQGETKNTVEETDVVKDITVFNAKTSAVAVRDGKELSVSKDMKLKYGDDLSTDDTGFLRLALDDEEFVYLESSSDASVERKDNGIIVNLTKGEMVVEIQKPVDDFQIQTPNTCMAIRGTVVAAKVIPNADGSVTTYNYVLEGTAEITYDNKTASFTEGTGISVKSTNSVVTDVNECGSEEFDFKDVDTESLKGTDGKSVVLNEIVKDTVVRRLDNGNVEFGSFASENQSSIYTIKEVEPIEWIVLYENDDEMFLLSKYILESKQYHDNNKDSVTWETCSLRKWLNEDFYDAAFSEEEKERIKLVTLKNDDNPFTGVEGGNDTEDYVFLPSIADMTNPDYGFSENKDDFFYDEDLTPMANRMAVSKFRYKYPAELKQYSYDTGDGTFWWLRSPGLNSCDASFVGPYGQISEGGFDSDHGNNNYKGVRPAIVVKKQ